MNLELLDRLPGHRLAKMVRGSEESPETIGDWYGLTPDLYFSLAPGPVFLTMEGGECLGLNSDPEKCTLIAWDAAINAGPHASPFHLEPPGDFPSQGRIRTVRLFREQPRNARFQSMDRFSALIITLEDGHEIAFVHGLHDDSDDFAVVEPTEILPKFHDNWELVHHKGAG